jgi:hypothetical protein
MKILTSVMLGCNSIPMGACTHVIQFCSVKPCQEEIRLLIPLHIGFNLNILGRLYAQTDLIRNASNKN